MTAPNITTRWRSWAPYLLSVLRIVAAFLFMQFGTAKWFGFPAPIMPGGGTAPVGSLVWFAAVLETCGGPLLALGLFTRPVAFILSGEMAVAYFRAWAPRGFFPIANEGEEATLNAFLFLWLVTAGAGAWSVDAVLARRWGPWSAARRLTAFEPYA